MADLSEEEQEKLRIEQDHLVEITKDVTEILNDVVAKGASILYDNYIVSDMYNYTMSQDHILNFVT